ncbi:diguanylate phosphodiesterase [Paenibacillus curdlanolyticus YK9]|uniref:Diguanylate phosphodiesterase n=1 Tax=Paenibacillus curdlanolyticus YK9 TaxID=717606 RepID=E0IB95_9BACL|nr:EAL domain-containing protein [Paenibacillus curdlanolyticus]EFM10386.1 diguanylate phosphodiesterase [Paenibacillus curdlanolyticus YK9]
MSKALRSLEYEDLFHHYQPIVDGQSDVVYGYEALIRSRAGIGPGELFQNARQCGELYRLDTLSFEMAIAFYFGGERSPNDRTILFVNLLPSTLAHPSFPSFMSRMEGHYVRFFDRIVVELNESTEEANLWSTPGFAEGTGILRASGIRLALDDTGEGASSLRKFVELSPDIVKLDRYFAQGLTESGQKQRVVNLMAELCRNDSLLILEGVETEQDWEMARSLGVSLGQGYWLGRPGQLPF